MDERDWWKPWRGTWNFSVALQLPSSDAGIPFDARLVSSGTRPRRMTDSHAVAVAKNTLVERAAGASKRFSVLYSEAAAVAAKASCIHSRKLCCGVWSSFIDVQLTVSAEQLTEARRLAAIRRAVAVAGAEAVVRSVEVDLFHQVVLSDHGNTTAHLLLNGSNAWIKHDLAKAAANLRRAIGDYQPSGRWIRIAEVLNDFAADLSSNEKAQLINALAIFANRYDEEVSRTLRDVANGAAKDEEWRTKQPGHQNNGMPGA